MLPGQSASVRSSIRTAASPRAASSSARVAAGILSNGYAQDERLQIRDDAARERQTGASNQGAGASRITVTGMCASSNLFNVPRIPSRHFSTVNTPLARRRADGRATKRSELLIKMSEGWRETISRIVALRHVVHSVYVRRSITL